MVDLRVTIIVATSNFVSINITLMHKNQDRMIKCGSYFFEMIKARVSAFQVYLIL